ncbi:hypothetical protein HDU82_002272, partial [Entophlyctis luteolus]
MKEKSRPSLVPNHPAIARASLHNPLPIARHLYSFPFAVIYVLWLYAYLALYDELFGSKEFAMFTLILAIAGNVLALLSCQWSVSAKAFLTCNEVRLSGKNAAEGQQVFQVKDPAAAKLIKIIPAPHQGAGALCPIDMIRVEGKDVPFFFFQKNKFIYNSDKKFFEQLRFPTDDGKSIGELTAWRGLVSEQQIATTIERYGLNRFDVPIPTFLELFQEHAVAPFFVFQLFCVALWFLDDMWYYSLFTLFMLVVFESTVVMQRLKNLQEFRAMSIKPYPIYVYRQKAWKQIQTDEILPGDICSIKRSEEDCPVPADFVVVEGSCISNEAMLSGESTPQLKEAVTVRDEADIFDMESDKNQVLFGGTKILQVTSPAAGSAVPAAPDGGCVAIALKTGYSTQQGKLVRTIIYSTERITANNAESLYFILFLLVFAIAAAYYVWTEGSKNEDRKKEKILLDCILIITSVVPPELPMELSMAVNNSLLALVKQYVFCTEPFRIPFAGKIDVACFDKTGTLTAENLLMEGVSGLGNDTKKLLKPNEIPKQTAFVLAAAHALVQLDDDIIGDPMEKNTLESISWTLGKDEVVRPKVQGFKEKLDIKIVRRFQFSSALKRMSTVSLLNEHGNAQVLYAVKGAPETLRSMYADLPSDYDEVYKYWARRGSRVLALGYRIATNVKISHVRDIRRDDVESNLVFAGFLIFFCPLKPDSADAIAMLNNSSHRCVMITGDNALTACHVAKEVNIVSKPVLILDVRDSSLSWQSVDEDVKFDVDVSNSAKDGRLAKYELCVTGRGLAEVYGKPCFAALLPRIWIYARVSPTQKEDILNALKSAGYHTLMCGDGTNDVGALKQAHVGIALLDGDKEEIEKYNKSVMEKRKIEMAKKQTELREKLGMKPLAGIPTEVPGTAVSNSPSTAPKDPKEQFAKQMEALNAMLGDMEDLEAPQIKFGDASVAAPFTSKLGTVMS